MKAASQDKTNCIPRLHIAPPYFVLYITVDVWLYWDIAIRPSVGHQNKGADYEARYSDSF